MGFWVHYGCPAVFLGYTIRSMKTGATYLVCLCNLSNKHVPSLQNEGCMGGEVGGTWMDRWTENSEAYRNREKNVEKNWLGKKMLPRVIS